jgi:hypothetical protein
MNSRCKCSFFKDVRGERQCVVHVSKKCMQNFSETSWEMVPWKTEEVVQMKTGYKILEE